MSAEAPAGWKLVPLEPTDEMLRAACTAWMDRPSQQWKKTAGEYAREDWTAMLAAAPEPTQAAPSAAASEPSDFSPDVVRKAFEESFLAYFGRLPENALFDTLGEHWLDRLEDGRYEVTRVDDAWTGWLAAARRYAHIENLWRFAKLGHEQMFAECQRLNAAIAAPPEALAEQQALARDAERYRHFREHYSGLFCSRGRDLPSVIFHQTLDQPNQFTPTLLDAAIDAAMAPSPLADPA